MPAAQTNKSTAHIAGNTAVLYATRVYCYYELEKLLEFDLHVFGDEFRSLANVERSGPMDEKKDVFPKDADVVGLITEIIEFITGIAGESFSSFNTEISENNTFGGNNVHDALNNPEWITRAKSVIMELDDIGSLFKKYYIDYKTIDNEPVRRDYAVVLKAVFDYVTTLHVASDQVKYVADLTAGCLLGILAALSKMAAYKAYFEKKPTKILKYMVMLEMSDNQDITERLVSKLKALAAKKLETNKKKAANKASAQQASK